MVTRVVKVKFLLACDNPKTGLASPKGRLRPGVLKVRSLKIRLGRSNIFKFSKAGGIFWEKNIFEKIFLLFQTFPPTKPPFNFQTRSFTSSTIPLRENHHSLTFLRNFCILFLETINKLTN